MRQSRRTKAHASARLQQAYAYSHEIPLQGLLVSGLHVAANLQILTGSENSRKKNRFEVCDG